MEKVKTLIIGSGPAGYTAAIYATRAELNPVLYEGFQPGGQLTITNDVENFPGYPNGKKGTEIMNDIREQALRFKADIRQGIISKVDFSKRPFLCYINDKEQIEAETVIIATGALARWLGIKGEKKYQGYGVSACAVCDGFFYRKKTVAVVGGGDTACEDALYLSKLCKKVFLIHRRNELRASKVMQNKVFETENIEIIWDVIPEEIIGVEQEFSKEVTNLSLKNVKTNLKSIINVDGVFVAIGHTPNTDIFKGQLNLDENGYIKTQPGTTLTNIQGVFAAGDVQDTKYRQAITAAASGCMAALDAERFLIENS